MWVLLHSLFEEKEVLGFGHYVERIAAMALELAGFFVDSDTAGRVLLVGILLILLAGGIVLLTFGIRDLVRDLRKSLRSAPKT